MNDSATKKIRTKRQYDAAPERVFDAWLDTNLASRWLFAVPPWEMAEAEIDARVGGRYRFVIRKGDEEIEHIGEYLEIERPRRLVFTLAVPAFSDEVTEIEVEIEPSQDGCQLTLTDHRVPPEWFEDTKVGWESIVNELATVLSS